MRYSNGYLKKCISQILESEISSQKRQKKHNLLLSILFFSLLVHSFALTVVWGQQGELHNINNILTTMKYTESLINNISFVVEYKDDYAPGILGEKGLKRIKKVSYLYDKDGRIRIESEEFDYNDIDKDYKSKGFQTVSTYNLTKAMDLSLNKKENSRFISIRKEDHISSMRKPTGYINASEKTNSQLIEEAINEGMDIQLEKQTYTGQSIYIMTIPRKHHDRDYLYKLWLDPNHLYYPFKIERYINGKLQFICSSTAHEVSKDIYLPIEGDMEIYNCETETLSAKNHMKVTHAEVNRAQLPDSLFECEILPGTLVADSFSGTLIQYVVGALQENDAMLEELAKAVQQDNFVDRADIASKKVEPSLPVSDKQVNIGASNKAKRDHKIIGEISTTKRLFNRNDNILLYIIPLLIAGLISISIICYKIRHKRILD